MIHRALACLLFCGLLASCGWPRSDRDDAGRRDAGRADTGTEADSGSGEDAGTAEDAGSEDATVADAGTDAAAEDAGGDAGACMRRTEDASAIGRPCTMGDPSSCPMAYSCEPLHGIVVTHLCQIPCTQDCECPMGTACREFRDKNPRPRLYCQVL